MNDGHRGWTLAGVLIDASLVVGAIGGMFALWGVANIATVAIATSLAGVPITGRQFFWQHRSVTLGMWLWALHGIVSAIGLAIWFADEISTDRDSEASFHRIIMTCAAALIAQGIIALIAIYQCLLGHAKTAADSIGSGFCLLYAVAIGFWLLFVWK